MTHRSLTYFAFSYATLLWEFRNGSKLAWAHYHRQSVNRAAFWDGLEIRNVGQRGGFVDTLVEIWGLQEYTTGGFYSPASGDVVVDVGANVGLFSIWATRRAPGARILAFEPFAENCATLRRNLEGWSHRIRVYEMAVGAKAGSGRMLEMGERSLDHRLMAADDAAPAGPVVPVITLEQVVELAEAPMIDLLKMDIEGAEVDVLEAASPSVLRRIRRMTLEYHDNLRPGSRRRVEELLAATHRIVAVHGGEYGILQARLAELRQ